MICSGLSKEKDELDDIRPIYALSCFSLGIFMHFMQVPSRCLSKVNRKHMEEIISTYPFLRLTTHQAQRKHEEEIARNLSLSYINSFNSLSNFWEDYYNLL